MTSSHWLDLEKPPARGPVFTSTARRGPALLLFFAFLAIAFLILLIVVNTQPELLPVAGLLLVAALVIAVIMLSAKLHAARIRFEFDADGFTIQSEERKRVDWNDIEVVRTRVDKQVLLQLRDGRDIAIPPVFDDFGGLLEAIAHGITDNARAPLATNRTIAQKRVEYNASQWGLGALLFFPAVVILPAAAMNAGVWIIAFLWLVLAMRALNRRVMSMVVDRATLRLTTMRRSWIIPLSSIRETCLVVIGLERLHVAVKDASERTFILPFPEQAVDVMQEIQRARAATPANGVRVMSAHVDPRGRRSLMSALSIAAVLIALVVPVYTGLALGEAARFGKRSAVHMLLDVGAPIDGRGSSGRPPLYQAAKFGREHIVLDLIARGADPVAPERKYGFTSLHMAAQENRPRIAEILLAHGVPVDVRNARGRTPLLHAASHGIADNVELAALLLNAGARIDAADNEGFTAVHIAAQEENLHFLRYIVSKGAAIDQLNGGFGTALSAASRRGRPDLVRELQALGADINTIVYSSRSPLGIAVGDGDLHMVEALMSLGARTDVQGRDSYTPLHFAVYIGRHDMVHSMLAAGARPNLNVPRMPPPLMMAVRQADTTMIRILLDAGASPGYMWNGRTPLQLAMQLGDSHVIAMLRRRTSR